MSLSASTLERASGVLLLVVGARLALLANGAGTGVAVMAFGLLTVTGVVAGLIYRRRRSRDPDEGTLTPAELESPAPA